MEFRSIVIQMSHILRRLRFRYVWVGLSFCLAMSWSDRISAATSCEQHQIHLAAFHKVLGQLQQFFWHDELLENNQVPELKTNNSPAIGQSLFTSEHDREIFSVSSSEALPRSIAGDSRNKSNCGRCSVSHFYLGGLAMIFLMALKMRHFTLRKRLDLARSMVERGIDPPEHLLGQQGGNDLKRGVVLTFAGIGLLAATGMAGAEKLAPAGLIPIFVGIGYLICHRFARGERSNPG